ncbi:MAG TPA: hypothetical protein VGK20_11990 [Candidatus Binatia bacterium]
MAEEDVKFSGSPNTMIALALVASALSLALSVWSLSRVGDLEAFMAVQAIRAQQHKVVAN